MMTDDEIGGELMTAFREVLTKHGFAVSINPMAEPRLLPQGHGASACHDNGIHIRSVRTYWTPTDEIIWRFDLHALARKR